MKEKKVYLTIAYMFIVLAMTFLVVNTEVLAIESNAENSTVNTNVSTEKTTFKAKVKSENFHSGTMFVNQLNQRELIIGLTKNGVDLGADYERKVYTDKNEIDLMWDNLDKYTIENGIKKENVYKVKLKNKNLNEEKYKVELSSNEIIVTFKMNLKGYDANIKFEGFEENEIKPNFTVEVYSLSEPNKTLGEKYDKKVEPGKETSVELKWKELPYNKNLGYGIKIKNPKALDKEKYTVAELGSEIRVIKDKVLDEETDQYIEINDMALKRILIDIINENNRNNPDYKEKKMYSKISKTELEKIKEIGTLSKEVESYSKRYNLNEVKNFEVIKYLTSLEEVNLTVSDEKQLSEFSKLKTIKRLQLEIVNPDFDIKVLDQFTNLEKLQLINLIGANNYLKREFDNLKDLNFLKNMKKLESLKIINQRLSIKNLDAIKNSNLKELILHIKNMTTITPIIENGNIEKLDITVPNDMHRIKNGTSEEKMNALLDIEAQFYMYNKKRKNLTRDEVLDTFYKQYGVGYSKEEYIKMLKDLEDHYVLNDLKEIGKMTKLRELTLSGVKLENIDGISKLKNLTYLNISRNYVTNIDELLKLENLKGININRLPIYDRRVKEKLSEKNVAGSEPYDESEHIYETFLVDPEKFTLPDMYDRYGNKVDYLNKENKLLSDSGFFGVIGDLIDPYKDINNFIKKNEDGTYSYIYKPYTPLKIAIRSDKENREESNIEIEILPINKEYNNQDLNSDKESEKHKIDKTKIVEFKNEKIKTLVLSILKDKFRKNSPKITTFNYVKDEKEMDVYEDELKYIENINPELDWDDKLLDFHIRLSADEDLSDIAKLYNLRVLSLPYIVAGEVKNFEFLKDLTNLEELEINEPKEGLNLPKFNENNKLRSLIIKNDYGINSGTSEYISKILASNLNNLKELKIPIPYKDIRRHDYKNIRNSLLGIEEFKDLVKFWYSYGGDLNYVSDTFNINYKNKKLVTDIYMDNFDKNTDDILDITSIFNPDTKKFKINILDKVNNKNIKIDDPILKKNEDGTYELVRYDKKIQEVIFEIDGKKVRLKIDISNMPLTEEEKNELKVYESKELVYSIKKDDNFDILKNHQDIESLELVNPDNVDVNKLNWEAIRNLKHLKKLNISKIFGNDRTFNISNISGIETLEELKIDETSKKIDIERYREYDRSIERDYNVRDYKLENAEKIAEFKNLKVLEISSAKIKNFDFLSKLTKLEKIKLFNDELENVDMLKDLAELKEVYLSNNKLTNIDGLKDKKKLTVVDIAINKLTNIDSLEKSEKLNYLNIAENDIENVDVLRNFKKLNLLQIIRNNKIKDITGLKESLKENEGAHIFIFFGDNSISDDDIIDLGKANSRVEITGRVLNTVRLKPNTNKFDINLTQNGNKIILSNAPDFRNSGLIKNEDGTYSFKDYKNSKVVRLFVGEMPEYVTDNTYSTDEDGLEWYYRSYYYRPYSVVYIDPSDIREEDKVVPTPEKEEENPKEENKVEEKIEVKSNRKLPYAGMQDDTMLKVLLVLVAMYTMASFNLYKKGLEKENNNK